MDVTQERNCWCLCAVLRRRKMSWARICIKGIIWLSNKTMTITHVGLLWSKSLVQLIYLVWSDIMSVTNYQIVMKERMYVYIFNTFVLSWYQISWTVSHEWLGNCTWRWKLQASHSVFFKSSLMTVTKLVIIHDLSIYLMRPKVNHISGYELIYLYSLLFLNLVRKQNLTSPCNSCSFFIIIMNCFSS